MPRPPSPPLSPHERTALWVQAQAAQAYAHDQHSQHSPVSPARSSTKTESTHRTTQSSDAVSYQHQPPSLMRAASLQQSSSSTRPPKARDTQRPRYDSRTRRSSLPFPQSPPGSGYPVQLEICPPRSPSTRTPRPSLRKERRPSLIDQLISFGTPSIRRKDGPSDSDDLTICAFLEAAFFASLVSLAANPLCEQTSISVIDAGHKHNVCE
ncbi:uncharacterized protein BXZ73DRAFT_77545 [Epithele typhae]|uniref:uncharacterized protein n=1 Tax=Epithele typhae TaxID=378194 RepID=UPI002008D1F6|nr:uncharacterized protein BXZ73DRAFT_77545 [Epithele typhae]KAH9932020.1 hypothetical protein BXZ73DRAFT_77545 [Epithele typhae]